MNRIHFIFLLCALILWSCSKTQTNTEQSQSEETTSEVGRKTVELPRNPSPAASVSQTVGRSVVSINYSRPNVISSEGIDRTGKIWGKLVPFEFNFRPAMGGGKPRPWRAGANENTTIEFSDDASVKGQSIDGGKYGVHMVLHEAGRATVIFSKVSDAWGSFSYDESEDALRIEAETEDIPPTERLIYTITDVTLTSAKINLDWERKRISFTIEFDTHKMVFDELKKYLSDTTGLTWRDFNRAANYFSATDQYLEESIRWIDQSISLEKNYTNLMTKSKLVTALGITEDGIELIREALELTTTTANNYYSYGTSLVRIKKYDEAMKIYMQLHVKWPDHWLTAHGLGRGYSAIGDYKAALVHEKVALTKAPEANKGFIEQAILTLESGMDFN